MGNIATLVQNLAAGSLLVTLTVLIHTGGLILIAVTTPLVARWLGLNNHDIGRTLVMTATVLGILVILTVEVWCWAVLYTALDTTNNFSDALFLSTSMFSTIGYSQTSFDPGWRLLTALEGVTGFLMIGWSTAYLVRASTEHGPFRKHHF
jgi:hypothetical protein